MSSPEFRKYIGLSETQNFEGLRNAILRVDLIKLEEVLGDLRSRSGELPILRDSRDATDYGRVLMNTSARETLRTTGDLSAAVTIIDEELLPDRIKRLTRKVDALATEVKNSDYSRETEDAAK